MNVSATGVDATVELSPPFVIIRRKRKSYGFSSLPSGDNYIALASIKSIQFRAATAFANGSIKFDLSGASETSRQIWKEVRNENIVFFKRAQEPAFRLLLAQLNEPRPTAYDARLPADDDSEDRSPAPSRFASTEALPPPPAAKLITDRNRRDGAGQSWPAGEEIVDAEYEEVGTAPLADTPPLTPEIKPMSVIAGIAALGALIVVIITSASGGDGTASAGQPASDAQAATDTPSAGDAESKGAASQSAVSDRAAKRTPILAGRCYMGECSWSRTLKQQIVKQDKGAALIKVSVLFGSSQHEYDAYPNSPKDAHIQWDRAPQEIYLLCSAAFPSYITKEGQSYRADVLDFVGGIPGVQEDEATLYTHECHPGDDWAAEDFVSRHGYQSPGDVTDVSLASPTDIFSRLPQ